jgi:hypothetical protein
MNLKEIGCEGVDPVQLVQAGAVTGSFEDGNDLSGCTKGGEFLVQLNNCLFRRILHH